MAPNPRMKIALLILFLMGLTAGCGSSSNPSGPTASDQKKQALMEVGEMYRLYTATAKKTPSRVEDFQSSQPITPLGYRAVKDGDVVVVWGAILADTSEEGSKDSADEVLAYEKATPEQGGEVLMKNRTVKTMTADQFKAAPKAGKN